MVIGNWKTSLILGLVALLLWTVPLVWYFIGNHRIGLWWQGLLSHLRRKPRPE